MSDLESKIEDTNFVTINTLSKEDLTAIVANPEYKVLLTELLNVNDHSAHPENRPSDGTTSNLDTSDGTNPATHDEESPTPNQVDDDVPPPAKRRRGMVNNQVH